MIVSWGLKWRSIKRLRNKSRYRLQSPCVHTRPLNYDLEGPWHEVTKAIHDCHVAVHAKGAPRIATDVRIGTRVDKKISPGGGNDHKVARVLEILAKDNVP